MDDAHSFEEGIKKKERRKERGPFCNAGGGGGAEAMGTRVMMQGDSGIMCKISFVEGIAEQNQYLLHAV